MLPHSKIHVKKLKAFPGMRSLSPQCNSSVHSGYKEVLVQTSEPQREH